MDKADFITAATGYFKALGYKKNRNYWFKPCEDIVYCVFLQNSQWSTEDYYVEVGIALLKDVGPKPCLTNWYVRKRCWDEKDYCTNVSLDDVIKAIEFFNEVHNADELMQYMEKTPHISIGLQYELTKKRE